MPSAAPSVEIERKFLVERVPDGLDAGEPIDQGYLAIADDGVEVRVRRRGEATVLTVKSGPAMCGSRRRWRSTSGASRRCGRSPTAAG